MLRLKSFERNNSHDSEEQVFRSRRIDTDNISWDNFGELDICRSQKNNTLDIFSGTKIRREKHLPIAFT